MPKTTRAPGALIPEGLKFTTIEGDSFVRIKDAAKLAGIHPVVLEMGQQLLKAVGGKGASFALGTPDLQRNGAEIEKVFKTGLRRVAKAFNPNQKLKVKTFRDTGKLVCWYQA